MARRARPRWADTTSTTFDRVQPVSGAWTSHAYAAPLTNPASGDTAALDPSGNPVIATNGGSTVYAYGGGSWSSETTPLVAQGTTPQLAIDSAGNPTVASWSAGYIQIARYTANGWETGTLGPTPTSRYPVYALALDATGGPVVCWVPDEGEDGPDDTVVCSSW